MIPNSFSKGISVQEGSSEKHFDHGQFEIKTFPIYAPPYYSYNIYDFMKYNVVKENTSSLIIKRNCKQGFK